MSATKREKEFYEREELYIFSHWGNRKDIIKTMKSEQAERNKISTGMKKSSISKQYDVKKTG